MRTLVALAPALLALASLSCQRQPVAPLPSPGVHTGVTPPKPDAKPFPPLPNQTHLENAHVVTPKILSGAQPEGEESFKALRDLGVKTIVSVDGSKPDVQTARKYGIAYVHLPITYSGVKPEEGKAIAKALDELPGPIYVHCHHGKHRSAAAVAVACVYNGMIRPDQATAVLETFGTGANYKGLWQSARDARPLPPEELRNLKVEFTEAAKIPPMADAMVLIDRHWDHLKAIQKNNWQPPADHPDLDPPHEALQLQELFHEIHRTDKTHADNSDFTRLMAQSESAAQALRAALAATPRNPEAANTAFKQIAQSCTACHKAHRD